MIPTFSILLAYNQHHDILKVDLIDSSRKRLTIAEKSFLGTGDLSRYVLDTFCEFALDEIVLPEQLDNGRSTLMRPTEIQLSRIFPTVYVGRESDGYVVEYKDSLYRGWSDPVETTENLMLYGDLHKYLEQYRVGKTKDLDVRPVHFGSSEYVSQGDLIKHGLNDLFFDLSQNITHLTVEEKAREISTRMKGTPATFSTISHQIKSQLKQMGYHIKPARVPGFLDKVEEAYLLD